MSSIAASIPDQLPLARIETVTFYKRDELTTDLICCDVEIAGRIRFFHEEQEGWDALLTHLEKLPGFRRDWRDTVMPPPSARNQFTAFEQPDKVT